MEILSQKPSPTPEPKPTPPLEPKPTSGATRPSSDTPKGETQKK